MKTIRKVFFRSFLLQAVWNYELMQGVGYLYSILPELKKLYGEKTEELIAACRRHLTYFNTHPYMVAFVIGTSTRIEEEISRGKAGAEEYSTKIKLQLGGPLAALGDKIFWATWRPLTGLTAVFCVFAGVRPGYLIPLVFILFYNIPIIIFRWRSLVLAYRAQTEIADEVWKINNSFITKALPYFGLLAITGCIVAAAITWPGFRGLQLAVYTAIVVILKPRLKLSVTAMLYIIAAISIAAGLMI